MVAHAQNNKVYAPVNLSCACTGMSSHCNNIVMASQRIKASSAQVREFERDEEAGGME